MKGNSLLSGFYKLSMENRWNLLAELTDLSQDDVEILKKTGALDIESANRMVENVIGTFELPLGLAMNFLINGKDYLIPFATEEPSVVAAASNAAKIARTKGGFKTSNNGTSMIGQIQILDVPDPEKGKAEILSAKDRLLQMANERDPMLVKFGGGARDIEVRVLESINGRMVIAHIVVDTKDAMGANAVNTMAEALAPELESITGGKVCLRILSNLAVYRLARAEAVFDMAALGGKEVVEGVFNAYAFADADPYRAATHNKGIMNGISAVVRATGNDTRAVEAGAHCFASITGSYKPLTRFKILESGDLHGEIELPMAIGTVGGATKVHPTAKLAVKMMEIKSASELGEIMAAVGLAQNLAALRALSTEGIQRGHMSLHAKNIAVQAGAAPEEIEKVVKELLARKAVREDVAREILKEIRA